MDKYEYKISLQEIDQLISEQRFDEAARIANTIDWTRVKNPATLCKISDVYKINREYAKSRKILVLANARDPQNAEIIYSLCELTIFLYGRDGLQNDLISAYQLKQNYQQAQPDNPKRLILEYKLYKVTDVSTQEKIGVLEELKREHYSARWGYELAKCYQDAGETEKAVAECRSVIAAFNGKYAARAEELLNTIAGMNPEETEESRKIEEATAQAIAGAQPAVDTTAPQNMAQNVQAESAQAISSGESAYNAAGSEQAGEPAYDAAGSESGREPSYTNAEVGNESAGEPSYTGAGSAPAAGSSYVAAGSRPAAGEEKAADGSASAEEQDKAQPQAGAGTSGTDVEELQKTVREGMRSAGTGTREAGEEAGADKTEESAPAAPSMSIGQVMSEWEKIKHSVRAQNDQRREQKILEDTGQLLSAFDETARHSMLEDIEKNVARMQREARQGYSYTDLSDGLTQGERRRAQAAGYYEDESASADEEPEEEGYTPLEEPADAVAEDTGDRGQALPEEDAQASYAAEDDQMSYAAAEDQQAYTPADAQEEYAPADGDDGYAPSGAEEDYAAADGEQAYAPADAQEEYVPADAEDAVAGQQEYAPADAQENDTSAGRERDYAPANIHEENVPADHREARGYAADADAAEEYGQGEGFNTAPQPYHEPSYRETLYEESEEDSAEPETSEEQFISHTQDEKTAGGTAEASDRAHDYGTVQEESSTEDAQEHTPSGSHTTRRWNAAAVRRAMEAERVRIAALEEEDRNRIESAVEQAGEAAREDTEQTEERSTAPAAHREKPAAAEPVQEETFRDTAAEEDVPAAGELSEESAQEEPAKEEIPEEEIPAEETAETAAPEEEAAENTKPGKDAEVEETAPEEPAESESTEDAVRDRAPEDSEAKAVPKRRERSPEQGRPAARQESGRGTDRELSDEEKKLFGPIALVKENRDQIVSALDRISLASYTGNVIITGAQAAATRVAQGLLEITKQGDNNFTGKIAKAPVRALNKLSPQKLSATLSKIENGALQIEGASSLSDATLQALYHELEDKDRGLIVIMLDGTRAMNTFVKLHKEYLESFNVRIDIKPLNDKALVAYGKEYALAKDYSIDELGQLALSTRIASLQTRNHPVSTKEVREIVDQAISYASRKSLHTLMEILTHKRYDEDDRIIIHEKDFMHY